MRYQLVMQLPASSLADYDKLIELEHRIIELLGDLGEVDGHDMGSGEANIFIFTEGPERAFERIQTSGLANDVMSNLRVAYREVTGESFTLIHPPGFSRFTVA